MGKTVIASKDQERKALDQIRSIISSLGENSYVATAFEGCDNIAESNIEDDAADSMVSRIRGMQARMDISYRAATDLQRRLDIAQSTIDNLRIQLERELDWKPCRDAGTQMSQNSYSNLAAEADGHTSDVEDDPMYAGHLTDSEATDLVADETGFDRSKIEIIHEVSTYEANRHGQLRKTATYHRDPISVASDWMYVRFDVRCCGGCRRYYELINDDLYECSC